MAGWLRGNLGMLCGYQYSTGAGVVPITQCSRGLMVQCLGPGGTGRVQQGVHSMRCVAADNTQSRMVQHATHRGHSPQCV